MCGSHAGAHARLRPTAHAPWATMKTIPVNRS